MQVSWALWAAQVRKPQVLDAIPVRADARLIQKWKIQSEGNSHEEDVSVPIMKVLTESNMEAHSTKVDKQYVNYPVSCFNYDGNLYKNA